MHLQAESHSGAMNRSAMPPSAMRNVAPTPRHASDIAIEAEPLDQTMHLMGAVLSYPRNAEIFGEGAPADYLYKIVSGSVRTYKILSDGRRQIGGFYLSGDIFGIECGDTHMLSSEAITNVKVLVIKRSALNALAGRDAAIARDLFILTSRELQRVQKRVLLLCKSALERVVSFLLEMAEGVSPRNSIELPMSRQDIADYLGMTIKTVCRTLTSLESSAAIEVPTSRHIVLRDRLALNQMTGG
jgi:CRP/FNR family transcriptional regulator, nitrogen fixation regulation protein